MPRKRRIKASSSIYHIVIRGLDRQIMFETAKDYQKYMEIVDLYKSECDFKLYAYCLMSNHVHLLLKTGPVPLETIFRKINTHYASWFNMKYQRTGHLQQERYYSEPVEDVSYFINVIRYIHHNPTNAGLEIAPGTSYLWSSIHEYLSDNYVHIDSQDVFFIIAKDDLIDSQIMPDNNCLDIDKVSRRLPDDVARDIIREITGLENISSFSEAELKKRNEYIREFHAKGISVRQINRLTGISKGVVQRVLSMSS